MKAPILSIAIATKNRVSYCIQTIETILQLPDLDFELVIQDNSDSFELKEYIQANIKDERLVYNYTPPPFSSIDNFNEVIGLTKGEYVCMIGDDDGINPELIYIVKIMKEQSIDSLASSQSVEYFWPAAVKRFNYNGHLVIPNYSGKKISYNPLNKLKPLLFTGIVNYIPFNLPRVYHGIIKRLFLEKIKEKSGNYFGGLSPDIYSSICLSLLIEKHTLVDYPLTIAGTCKESTSAESESNQHNGELEKAPHLRSRENYEWDNMIPSYYSVQTIWAESGITALRDFERFELLKNFNLKFLVAQSLFLNPNIKKLIINRTKENIKDKKENCFLFGVQVFMIFIALKIRKSINKFKNIFIGGDNRNHINNIENIEMASTILNTYMQKNKISINDILTK